MRGKAAKRFLLVIVLMMFCMVGNKTHAKEELVCTTVTVQGKEMDINSTFLDCNNLYIEDFYLFIEELQQFPKLEKVELLKTNLSQDELCYLSDTLTDIKFVWKIVLLNHWTIRTDQIAFSLNKAPGPYEFLYLHDEDVEILKYCTDLVALDLGHSRFTKIDFVKYMPNLRIAIFSDGRIRDITPIRYCKDLVYFEAWFCPIINLKPLQYLINLKDINVSHCRQCSDITPLLGLPRLERIFIQYNNVSKADVQRLREAFPKAEIELTHYYAYDPDWRAVSRFYEMRKMYRTNSVSEAFMDDVDKLKYFEKVFDYYYYKERYPNVVRKVGDDPVELLYYFLNVGVYEQQKACEDFDVWEYMEENPDLRETLGRDYGKYMRYYLWGVA